jgi:AhpD family alkylhydroperoxidase
MDMRTRELIAIGAAVAANCVASLRHHTKKAREAGIGDSIIRDAVEVGREVRQGAANRLDKERAALFQGD